MKTINDIAEDDYEISLIEKWREDKLKDMEKMEIPSELKILLREIITDIYNEVDSLK